MRLQRVQVPDFRVLKNVDITFEKDFVPNIFPIGSQNGGGKSTLLQLIFVLLHCSIIPDRKEYIKNFLHDFSIPQNARKRTLAIIEIWNGIKTVKLTFLSHNNEFNVQDFSNRDITNTNLKFSDKYKLESIQKIIPVIEIEIKELQKKIQELESLKKIDSVTDRYNHFQSITNNIILSGIGLKINEVVTVDKIDKIIENISLKLAENQKNLLNYYQELHDIEQKVEIVIKILQSENLLYICNYASELRNNDNVVLLCKVENLEIDKAKLFLQAVSQKVFLAAPTSQVFLLFSYKLRSSLFRKQIQYDYNSFILDAKDRLPGFFTYDFLAVDLLIEAFKSSRDKDFREAIDNNGKYGNNYQTLIQNLNTLLGDKNIKLDADFSGITFQVNRDGKKIQLNPEDLSHGELKRLSIYMWIKFQNIEDAIVLMDEIEIAFHPDWQYQIISDLYQWSPSNQYILATHSYELCQALTPAHVKELDPKLLKPETRNQQ